MKRAENTVEKPEKNKQARWDFKSIAHFERFPTGETVSRQQGHGSSGTSSKACAKQNNSNNEPMFRETSHHVHKLERFSLSRHVTEFVLDANTKQPDEALRSAFEEIIKRAIRNSEEKGGQKVAKFGIWLMGRDGSIIYLCLNDPIVLPVRPPPQNNADVLIAELEKLGQSDGDEERDGGMDKRSLMLSEPVQIIDTCISPPGGAAPRFFPYQNWGYNRKQLIKINNVGDRFCMFYALIGGRTYHDLDAVEESHENTMITHNKHAMRNRARTIDRLMTDQLRLRNQVDQLMTAAEIPTNLQVYGIEHLELVQKYWDITAVGQYRIVLFEDQPEILPKPIWKGCAGRKFDVALFLSNGHYEAIKKINCFFKLGRKYCVDCECSYDKDAKHTIYCKSRCLQCSLVGPQHPCVKEDGVQILCEKCNRFFFSQNCFEGHRAQTCQLIKRCRGACKRVYQNDSKKPHKCFTSYCARCKVYHEKRSGCFIQKVKIPEEKQRYRIVCWDSETRLKQMEGGQKIHVVNYLSARITCTDCIDFAEEEATEDCEICKTEKGIVERMKDWSEADGDDAVAEFVEWILRAWSNEFKTYIWAHNASRFDGHFILKYLGETKRRPDVMMNGLKLFEFRVQHTRQHSSLTWRDSYLLMPIRLEELKKTFALACEDKPFFPYGFNRSENYNLRLLHLPDREDYFPGSMKKEKNEKFKKWYDENEFTPFFLPDELRDYCRNDTEILQKALIEFRRILMRDVTNGFDILPISCTIASACMSIYRAQFMPEALLARVPEAGYERNDRASVLAIKYLDWRSKVEGVHIQHAGNGREKKWKQYKLDGWIEEQNRCIEILGCYWHGCERCFLPDDKLVDGKTCRELNEASQDRLRQLREAESGGQCLHVEEIWECEINKQLSKNASMQEFFSNLGNERGPIDPRKAYCGGRTGPLKLYAQPAKDEKISVFDIVSLYPWVNYDTEYPVGIPEIIRPGPEQMLVDWTRPEQLLYRGIYRVRVIPPRGLRIPVLPVKLDERLLFCCCHVCASKFRKIGTRYDHKCRHSDKQRAFTGNYTHIELERALQHGYRIDRFWRAWNYKKWSDQIFKDYVRLLIKLKIEASGFPGGVETREQKQQFIEEYLRVYSVTLEIERISKNPGLRFIAKLMLNSLWGKFSMRNELGSNRVISSPQEFFKIVFDHKTEISAIIPISSETIRVLYKNKKQFVAEHSASNIIISLWTTSRARLKLLEYMMQIENTEGSQLLYTDTDSVIVLHKKDRVPIITGEYLGQMSEEYTGFDIREFVCGGAKQYAFRMVDIKTGKTEYLQKVRGITFDVNNSKTLQFQHFADQVLSYGRDDQRHSAAIFKYEQIRPTKDSRIITREQKKLYLPICQKGIITEDLNVLPFGFE